MQNLDMQINALISDSNFLELAKLRKRPNLFDTLAASHLEMWHSAFVKWLIDPNSHLGLNDFPLKRFLYLIVALGRTKGSKPELLISDIEDMNFNGIQFESEFNGDYLVSGKQRKIRIDIIGFSDEIKFKSKDETTSIRIVIENKIKATENKDQTKTYNEFCSETTSDFDFDFLIFLTPDESQMPKCDNFIQITYQELCDTVIKPCLNHPELLEESKYLLSQYLINLGKPIKGDRVMALPNKEICQKIYEAHKETLDEIFVSVKGEAPSGRTIKSFNITLEQLVNNGKLHIDDTLHATYLNKPYTAKLKKSADSVVIEYSGDEYNNPSKVSKAITGKESNGWIFWKVKDKSGRDKGRLADLRS